MAAATCPACGSDDLVPDASAPPGPGIAVACVACGHQSRRTPRLSCPRCGSGDVEQGVVDGWAYDDIEQAREHPEAPDWSYVDRVILSCRSCRNRWETVEGSRPYVPPT